MVTKGEGEERDKLEHIHTQFSSVAQSCLTLWPYRLQHTKVSCPSPTSRACSNSCPSSQWCHLTISSSVIPFSSCLPSLPASESCPVNRLLASDGQSSEAEAPILWLSDVKSQLIGKKKPWWWERLKAGGEGGDRGWDSWMILLIQWTWIWASFRRWWRTGKSGLLHSTRLQRVRRNWVTEQQ